ncbi:MAG: hypothetical protein JWN70_1913 [Planctomycetaceae bacterium]|nr:hypothetical protein [Planctomycetaceae bacterium]
MSRIEVMVSRSGWTVNGSNWWRSACLIVVGWCCCAPLIDVSVLNARAPTTRQNREKFQVALKASIKELQAEFAVNLEEIAKYCDDNDLLIEAKEVRQLAKPLPPDVLQGENLPRQVQLEIPKDLPEAEKTWRQRLRALQKEYADKVFAKAKTALDNGMISFAYDLVREVARHNPDHKFARKLLGYSQYGNEWVTIYAEKMLKKKHVLTEKYGWLRQEQVERYENGERYCDGKWMTAAREAEFRRDFQHAWVIQTDHYKIYTNHSLEMGVELGRHLEDFYRIFFQTFAGFLSSPDQLKKLFNTAAAGGTASDPFVVHYYRTEDEYIIRLQKKLRQTVKGTSGLYLSGERNIPDERVAHFFHNLEATEEERLATMFHEATHQLFSEAYTTNPKVGVESDFWVIEAIACYMESFHRKGDTFSLGDPHYIRFQNAQYRLLTDNYYVPLQKLCSMGMDTFQSDPNRSQNYSQGSGLAHFFMHHDDGAYRDAFIAYLSAVYDRNPKVRAKPPSLMQLTEVAYTQLDQQYRDYISRLKTGLEIDPAKVAPGPDKP